MSKILLAAMGLEIGGAETHIVELTHGLLSRGHDVTIVSSGGVYVKELSEAGAKHYWAPLDTRKPRDMAKSLGVLTFLIKTERFDIVHAHARIPAFLCGILKSFYKFNFVTTAHWKFSSRGLQKWLSNWGEHSVAVSEDIKQYLINIYRVDESDITVTVNGIDTAKFSPAVSGDRIRHELEIPVGAPVIVCVGRLDYTESAPTKTVQALIDIAPVLSERIKNLRIVIVGGGTREQEFFTRAADTNMQIGRNVLIMTGVRTDISEMLAAGDLFVGVSRSALEAMSVGLPVILAGSEGYLGLFTEDKLDSAVKTNFTCRGFGKTEAGPLCEDIIEFFAGFGKPAFDGKSAKLSAFGRETVVKLYSVARMIEDYERVYENQCTLKKHRVVMSGYYGFANTGDEAIMQAVYRNIIKARGGTSITVLSKNPAMTKTRYGYHAVGRFNPFGITMSIRKCDVLVFGGGSLLQDHTSTRSLIYYLSIIRVANFFRKPVMIYANGIGPVDRPKNRERVRRVIETAKTVTLRDENSLEELRNMGVKRSDIVVTGDPVYTMEMPSGDECEKILQDTGIEKSRPFAVVSVRKDSNNAHLFPELAKLCDMICSELGVAIVFIPMQSPGDLYVSRDVQALMSSPSDIIDSDCSAGDIIGILKNAQFAVSMRFHTLVFAARAGTPMAGIILDPKIEANLSMFGMPGLGTPQEVMAEPAFEIIKALFNDREVLSKRLVALSEEQRSRAETDAVKLTTLLDSI